MVDLCISNRLLSSNVLQHTLTNQCRYSKQLNMSRSIPTGDDDPEDELGGGILGGGPRG